MEISEDIRAKKRKRTGNVRVNAQLNKKSGNPYLTSQSKKYVPGKAAPGEAKCNCRFACTSVTVGARQKMFGDFCKMKHYNEQQSFLRGCIKTALINRRRHGMTLLGDLPVSDKRGGKRPQRNQAWKEKIVEFIASIPCRESHYGREKREKHPNKRYLSSDLNVTKLYTAFLEKHELAVLDKPPVSRQWFNEIFKKEFCLVFAPPRVDTCSTCDGYNISISTSKNPNDRRMEELKRDIHHRKAKATQTLMAKTVKDSQEPNSDTCVISYDLQQQSYIPTLTHTQMYYSTQYTCINLGIHLEDEAKGFMYMWEELAGKRGCNEIGSCLYTFITTELQSEKRKLIFWSDNCAGQNKNQGMLAIDFGCIERAKKGLKFEVPMDVIRIMATARKHKPFVITHTKKFFNWMQVAQCALMTKHLGISQAAIIKIDKKNLDQVEIKVEIKTSYCEVAPSKTVKVFKQGVNQQYFKTLIVEPTEQDIRNMKPWKKNKIKQIKDMIPYLSEQNQDFYKTIITKQEALSHGL
ncbi:hypothetical protein QE152_g38187 [Popillia japonica]|uniref:Uncharacterized protein n=1 Tax=Popillia japonica TaxID=7064 RepID=A0AAW1I7S7_POPJA